jgi:hypothetical protein
MSKFNDEVLDEKDYANMPKFELQNRAIMGDRKAERIYLNRYGANKIATLTPEFSIEQDEE